MIEATDVQRLDQLSQEMVVTFDSPGTQHVQGHCAFEIVQDDRAMSGAGEGFKIDQGKARGHQRARSTDPAGQGAQEAFELEIFKFASPATIALALDTFEA